ncbi:hypothetical protein NQ314_016009 [Rhamnusium bicolor]|uniref:Uncharacterized protein n=1 Tax=Rhamnusium bicolor TaxID=1586634 RepID=A0AAV8WXG0_9CUCU|nr:hypothetical protein NQ314_016009 [Rhamnusium bicolor]
MHRSGQIRSWVYRQRIHVKRCIL